MALIDYSDSESDGEATATPGPSNTVPGVKPAFQKAAPGKIKVDLPSIKPEPGPADIASADGPPPKRARTGGAFSGFNSLLPAPKRAAPVAAKAGISLKTSSEAAFSRNPLSQRADDQGEPRADQLSHGEHEEEESFKTTREEPKLVGKATKFLPLSVSNKKKKKPAAKPPSANELTDRKSDGKHSVMAKLVVESPAKDTEPLAKPKRSLFSVDNEEQPAPLRPANAEYEPFMTQKSEPYLSSEVEHSQTDLQPAPPVNPSSLEVTAAELNLTPSQRRQLFGRRGDKDANVMHFNLDNEYAANEQARQAGEVIEHRAVKAIAPGKHSLQQLVNNARTQQDAMEDKWAEGRRAKGEGGAKYGWSG